MIKQEISPLFTPLEASSQRTVGSNSALARILRSNLDSSTGVNNGRIFLFKTVPRLYGYITKEVWKTFYRYRSDDRTIIKYIV